MTIADSAEVRSVPRWRHRIRLPDGSITPGTQDTAAQLAVMDLPADLTGKTVLDIGCSDGFFSFECERRGAARVVGFDNYSSPYIDAPHGFAVAHRLLQSRVELVLGDLRRDLAALGTFDLVLFLGVLYHLKDPLGGLESVATACTDHLIVETAVTPPRVGWKWNLLRRLAPQALPAREMLFSGPEINRDPSTWWVQSTDCVEAMLRVAGFCDIRTIRHGWGRAFFHGRGPAHGADVTRFHAQHAPAVIERAFERLGGSARRELSTLKPFEFAVIRQAVAEIEAEAYYHSPTR